MDIEPQILQGQFVLTQDAARIPPSWAQRQHHGWILGSHPNLPISDLCLPDDAWIGWVVGHPLTDTALAPQRIPVAAEADRDPAPLEAFLATLGGRYVALVLTDSYQRVYLDSCGSMSAVYSSVAGMVASTPTLIDTADHPWDTDLMDALKMPASGLWYPFGLTSKRNVWRLIPNHYLDLATWQTKRYWPTELDFYGQSDPATAIRTIVATTTHILEGVARDRPIYLTLTAGRDSRMILACAKSVLDRARFFTFTIRRDTADAHIARRLARRHGLKHQELPKEYATEAQIRSWLLQTGQSVGGEIAKVHPTVRHLDRSHMLMTGMAGEVGRGFYWRATDTPTSRLTATELLNRCSLPLHERFVPEAQRWLDAIPTTNAFFILDLLYWEQRLGAWAGPQGYGGDAAGSMWQVFPLGHRTTFTAMLSLPVAYRQQQQLPIDMCRTAWPELLDLPFNQFSGFWRYPRRVAKYILLTGRKLVAMLRR
jgi:hypothetical protein